MNVFLLKIISYGENTALKSLFNPKNDAYEISYYKNQKG